MKKTRAEKIEGYARAYRERINQDVDHRLRHILRSSKNRSQKMNRHISITFRDVQEMWEEQDGICAISGIPMTITTGSKDLVSIDRIDSAMWYHRLNVQLVCSMVNMGKNNLTTKDFIDMCTAVSERNKK